MADINAIKAAQEAIDKATAEASNAAPGTLERAIADEHVKQAREEYAAALTEHVKKVRRK